MNFIEKHLSTTQIIILSFFLADIAGALLLALPISAADGRATPFIDALFTSTTSICVTGLVTVTTASHWSLFGHIVILVLIQTGGLGVVTMTMTVMLALGKRITMRNRMLLGDSFNMDTLKGLVNFLRRVFFGTFIVEGIGAVCYLPVFVPEYGIVRGIWYSVFHAVSAFCNAGIDVLGDSSFMPYVHNTWVNIVTMCLIVLGGIGFIVWWDIIRFIRLKSSEDTRRATGMHNISLHSKIVLSMTFFLIVAGSVMYLVFEFHNPKTIGNYTAGEKVLAALFQSVTTRTAGFATISQAGLTAPSVILSVILMFIGGSSVGTAGGVKTSTIAVILMTVMATVRGQADITCFHRRVSAKTVRKAVAIVLISFMASIIALTAMFLLERGNPADIIFEVYSALGTAGLTRDYTPLMGMSGKVIITVCMFLGRIGPISMVIAFTMRDKQSAVHLPEESITVG